MSIDIFGRPFTNVKSGQRGPTGRGFNVTSDGDYNIENKRLCNLGNPSNEHDAATVQFVLRQMSELYKSIDSEQKEISHLHSEIVILKAAVGNLQTTIEEVKAVLSSHQNNIKYLTEKLNERQKDSDS